MDCSNFEKNIFINCPFDGSYRKILIGIIFTVYYFNFKPRLAFERSDSAEPRINKILNLIEESKFGIHDLSRMVADEKGEHYRMNMPFELGIDYGCRHFKGEKWANKKILVLEEKKYRYQVAISDLAGSDIKHHNNDVFKAMSAVREWLVTEELKRGNSINAVWNRFNDFHAYLYEETIEKDQHESTDEVAINEIMHHMNEWFKSF